MTDSIAYVDIRELVSDLKTISNLSTGEITENIFRDYGAKIEALAKQKAPHKTGALKSSITHHASQETLEIVAGVDYAMYQEFGTASRGEFNGAPYTITPKKGQYLVFYVNGKKVVTRKVTHPGIPAHPYLRPAVQEAFGELFVKLAERGQAMILKGPNSDLA
ncbi:MAG: HK97 gp10 family phage protein [Desulfurellales bacterium]|nr:MAG: HK97 gp10 family phage protein [Desulfurellales bacterium]